MEKNPSNTYDLYWLNVENNKVKSHVTNRSGKWLLFFNLDQIDNMWKIIKNNVENGNLGPCAKVSTMKNNPNKIKVICVYSNNYKNTQDVTRIGLKLIELLNLSVTIHYKTDLQTQNGIYGPKSYLYKINSTDKILQKNRLSKNKTFQNSKH